MAEEGFYLGRRISIDGRLPTEERLVYHPADLTTHAVIVGMTGSGKTGLLINLLEEIALAGIPAIIIDPKGDLTNLLLHFPGLSPEDFKPWIDPDAALRQGKSVEQVSVETAERWRKGLQESDIAPDRVAELGSAVDFELYTPGSTAGTPINLLSSFQSPGMDWHAHREGLREKIASVVTALLGLLGLQNVDPLRSREHILLSHIFERAWSSGFPLDLTELIWQVQSPPFERLGAFPINSFFPEKERKDLALLLNNLLISPSFQTWLEGKPLDIAALLYTPRGKPRHCLFYLAHLDEMDRMFFVTLLLAAVESWARAQRGSSGLRAVLAFDEIVGYLPPIANPPSRPVMVRLLKQARAFGLGLVLATQNPIDLDYKALANAGSWFIGRLQTEQDKQRLQEGLRTVQAVDGSLDALSAVRMIGSLRARQFFLNNIHHPGLQLFQTRWSMNYLAGPLTRAQIPDLVNLVKKSAFSFDHLRGAFSETGKPSSPSARPPASEGRPVPGKPWEAPGKPDSSSAPFIQPDLTIEELDVGKPLEKTAPALSGKIWGNDALYSTTRPAIPQSAAEFFLPDSLGMSRAAAMVLPAVVRGPVEPMGILYRAAFIAQAQVRYLNRKMNLDLTRKVSIVLADLDGNLADWDDYIVQPFDAKALDNNLPLPGARYDRLPEWLSTSRQVAALQKDFLDWVARTATLRLWVNDGLKLTSISGESQPAFQERCARAAKEEIRAAREKLDQSLSPKFQALNLKIERQKGLVEQYGDKVSHLRTEQLGANAEYIFGLFGRRKRSINTSLTKNRMTNQAKNQLQQARTLLKELQNQQSALQAERDASYQEIQEKWEGFLHQTREINIQPTRRDVSLEISGVGWTPYYLLRVEGRIIEARAYAIEK